MTRISTGTVSIDNGATIFTLWVGDADVTLSEITAPAGSHVVIQGVANFIKTRPSSTSAELVLPHAGPGGAGLACAISAMTPAETQVGTLNARVAGVIQGLAVVQANGLGLGYRFSTATADADPGPGYVRLNHADPALATMMYIDDVSGSGFEVGELVSRWGIGSSLIKGTVQLSSAANDGAFAGFEVTGPVIDGGSYRKVPIAVIGDPSAWSDEAELMVAFAATGDAGEGYITDAIVADRSELAALESEDPGYLVFVTDLGTDFGAYSGRSGVVRLIAGPDWEVTAVYTGATGPASTVPGPTGPAGLVWVSTAWDAGTTYALNEAVQKDGSSWRSLQDGNLNHSPPTLPTISNAWWALVARRGNDGAGTVAGVTAGAGTAVNNTDPTNPEVSVVAFTGDSGSGGALGGVPAPAAGDAAANKYLSADGGWQPIDLSKRVSIEEQTLTAAAQLQARTNIGLEFGYPLLHIQEQVSGASAGTSTSGFNYRNLNTIVTDEIAGATLTTGSGANAGVIFLPEGTYYVEAMAPASIPNRHVLNIVRHSDKVAIKLGHPGYASAEANDWAHNRGRLAIGAGGLSIQLSHHIASGRGTDGLGINSAVNSVNMYADFKAWKLK